MSSLFTAKRHAGWTDTKYCGCGYKNLKCIRLKWIKVPLAPFLLKILADWFEEIVHDAVQFDIICLNCNNSAAATIEYSPQGKTLSFGKYDIQTSIYEKRCDKILVSDVIYHLNNIYYGLTGQNYDMIEMNCKHFSQIFVSHISLFL